MKIGGLQKLTLLDYPGLVACTIFTVGCNFRCPFCHNASLVTGKPYETIDENYVLEFLKTRKGKLDGVCITGGEPLLQKDIEEFIAEIKNLGFLVKLDTNGSFPQRLQSILDKGLVDYVAMDIKNSPEKYADTCGIPWLEIENIKKSVDILRQSGVEHEFRTTVVKELHLPQDIEALSCAFAGSENYYLQNFRDSGDIIESGCSPMSHEEMKRLAAAAKSGFPNSSIRGE